MFKSCICFPLDNSLIHHRKSSWPFGILKMIRSDLCSQSTALLSFHFLTIIISMPRPEAICFSDRLEPSKKRSKTPRPYQHFPHLRCICMLMLKTTKMTSWQIINQLNYFERKYILWMRKKTCWRNIIAEPENIRI